MNWKWLKRLFGRGELEPHRTFSAGSSSAGSPATFRHIGCVPLDTSQPITSGLSNSTLAAINNLLHFKTKPGHGWIGTPTPYDCPEPFQARLQRFFYWRGNRRGGVARVEQPGHPCDGYWAIFATRHLGTFDFHAQTEHFNVAILSAAPDDPVDSGTFWVLTEELPGLLMAGFAEITAAPSTQQH